MKKVRVYELAKKLNIASKELIEKMEELGLEVSSHMSTIENEEAQIINEYFGQDEDEEVVEEETVEEVEEVKEIEEIEEVVEELVDEDAIEIAGTIVIKDLAEILDMSSAQIITKLIGFGVMANINQEIDFETASLLAEEAGIVLVEKEVTEEDIQADIEEEFNLDREDSPNELKSRPPVVTVMGHVDHGKTSLLDAIRDSSVRTGEAGGITQHIGASVADVKGQKIVFLDTPGHEAFTSMRARGTQVTDIAILVVAADDGIMPQTIEAINHARAAEVPIIIAVNKMDKPDANVDRIKQDLTEYGLMAEDWGGDTIVMPVSALKGEGIEELLEMVLLVAEMQELKANPNRKAVGSIVEAQLDKGRGPVATVLVQKGTLKVGDLVVSGTASGRVRAMFDDKGKNIKKAGPAIPAMILGLSEVPDAGNTIYAVKDEKTARIIANKRKEYNREEQMKVSSNVSLDDLFDQIQSGNVKDLNLIVKTDVKGTIDAISQSLTKLENEEVNVNIIHGGVGGITESDVMLATASNAIIIGFNVRPTLGATDKAKEEGIDIRTYRVIYEAIEDIKAAVTGMLDPEYVEEVIGRAEVRAVFKVPHAGNVSGIYIQQGKITRDSTIRLLRDDIVLHEGNISSLRRFKDDVKEIATGYEGGIGLENYNDVKEGDVFEAYIMKEIKRG